MAPKNIESHVGGVGPNSGEARARRRALVEVAIGAVCLSVLFTLVAANSVRWIGDTFPGFFVMANRVVPSVSLPNWVGADALFQSQVVAVDGVPVADAHEIYRIVGALPDQSTVTYQLIRPQGSPLVASVPTRKFSLSDFALIHGGLLANGLAFAVIGLFVLYLKPGRSATYGLLSSTLAAGTFFITAADLYGPFWFFRLHVLAESFLTPAFIHLALVFPTDRMRRHRRSILAGVYAPFLLLGLHYEWALGQPAAYTNAHLLATASHGVAVIVLLGLMGQAFGVASPLVRRRIGIVGLGILAGVGLPLTLAAVSALVGGSVPVNAGVLTAFFFPLSLGYAIVQQDLFEIDRMLRRWLTYIGVLVAATSAYFVALFFIGMLLPANERWIQSPATTAILNLTILLLFVPIRDRVRNAVDRVFLRKGYDAEAALSQLSQHLAVSRSADAVASHVLDVIRTNLHASHLAIALYDGNNRFTHLAGREHDGDTIQLPTDLTRRIEQGEVLARYEWEDGSGGYVPPFWAQWDAEILVPIRSGADLNGIIILGALASGRAYNIQDLALLRTIANQVVLAMTSAAVFGKLEVLNERLELQVRERTTALQNTNAELNRSLRELRHAYELLERNQASLLRADRLSTLGRLVAGMAHEINTPLAAVQNSLQVLLDLADEYATSIDDPKVLPADHRQIAGEIRSTAASAATWARKAAVYLSRTKLQGRELQPGVCQSFRVKAVADETYHLLAHRLRAAACSIEFSESPNGIELMGDQHRLGQVLVNLANNAIDAYEDNGIVDGKIEIKAEAKADEVTLSVRDWAGGISSEVLPHIFDELFTTKEPGKGTGLGLWIARNLVEESFGGKLTVQSTFGVGSCLTATLPNRREDGAEVDSTAESAVNQVGA